MTATEIFGQKSRWVTYQAELHIDTLVGGIPKDPDTIRGWLKARLELNDVEIMAIAEETIGQMGWSQAQSTEQLEELLDQVMAKAGAKGNSFKMIDDQLVWEGRCLKAALREAANVCYPGVQKWPGWPGEGIKKGLSKWMEERVEVRDLYLPLGRSRPDIEAEQRIKHVSIPGQGKRSTINVVDLVTDVKVTANIWVQDDCIKPQLWQELWEYVEIGGVGADRARGDGRCRLIRWERQ
jgi:hypothetical protein